MAESTRPSDGPFGARGKRLSELSDAELADEAARRRRARGAAPTESAGSSPIDRRDLLRYFANLELPPSASLADVKAAYERLKAKYDPGRFADASAQHRTAVELVASLTKAYEALTAHLGRRGVD